MKLQKGVKSILSNGLQKHCRLVMIYANEELKTK